MAWHKITNSMNKLWLLLFLDDEWQVTAKFVDEDGKTVLEGESPEIYRSRFIAIATGHHAKPSMAKFPGQDSFTGLLFFL
jgi:dimethylaniline monooxygenase (N-oxide forming)